MKRYFYMMVATLLMTAGAAARAQEAAGEPVDLKSFEIIAQKNIFDPNRSGRVRSSSRPRTPVTLAFTYNGSAGDAAFFDGYGVPHKGWVNVGESLNGFKVRQITLHYVKLTDPAGKIVALKRDQSMRRDDNGPWTKSDLPPPTAVASTPAPSADSAAPAAAGAGGAESDVIRKLRLKREQEDK